MRILYPNLYQYHHELSDKCPILPLVHTVVWTPEIGKNGLDNYVCAARASKIVSDGGVESRSFPSSCHAVTNAIPLMVHVGLPESEL